MKFSNLVYLLSAVHHIIIHVFHSITKDVGHNTWLLKTVSIYISFFNLKHHWISAYKYRVKP